MGFDSYLPRFPFPATFQAMRYVRSLRRGVITTPHDRLFILEALQSLDGSTSWPSLGVKYPRVHQSASHWAFEVFACGNRKFIKDCIDEHGGCES